MDQPTDRDQPNPERRNPFEDGGLLDESGVTRRKLLKMGGLGAGALALPGLIAACGGGGGGGTTSASGTEGGGGETSEDPELTKLLDGITSKQVIIGNYGGDTEEVRRRVFWEPFEARTGCKVVSADAGSLAYPMLLGEIPPKWDAIHGSTLEVATAEEFGKKPLPKTPEIAWEDLVVPEKYRDQQWQSFFTAYTYSAIEGTFDTEPTTWADFFDTKKFPGKRAWPAEYFIGGVFEAALMADGVPPDEVYPFDFERATAKISSIFDDFVIYTEYAQAQSFLTSKTVSMSYAPNGLWFQLEAKGVPAKTIWDATPIVNINGMNNIPDGPNPDAVEALAAWCKQPQLQAEFSRSTNYGPGTSEAFDELTDEEVENLPNAPQRTNIVEEDAAYIAKNYGTIEEENQRVFAEA